MKVVKGCFLGSQHVGMTVLGHELHSRNLFASDISRF